MKWRADLVWMIVLTTGYASVAAADDQIVDLKRGVPSGAYLAVYARHNPERDYQREYWQEVCDAVEDSQILQRALKLATSRVPDEELDEAKAVFDELKTAIEPIDFGDLTDAKEFIYAQRMDTMTSQHLVLVRMTPEAAARYAKGLENLFRLAEKYSDGDVPMKVAPDSPAHLSVLELPHEVPFRPAFAHYGDVFVFASSEDFAKQSLDNLLGGSGESKFDDPRLRAALEQLPAAEDAIVFFDARAQFQQLRNMFAGIAEKAGDHPEAERWLGVMSKVFDEISVFDYEITVEYTEDNLNRSATLGRLVPGTEDRLLTKVFSQGEAFEEWHSWVPADATSYTLSRGADLHAAYVYITKFVKENVPEASVVFDRLEEWQDEHDLHIDQDILQAFSGESVSVSVPAEIPTMLSSEHSVVAMRCQDPQGIRKLFHRLVGILEEIPMMKMQQLRLAESEDLDGFEKLSATIFAAFGAEPVIGFRDGWMICGTNAKVVEKVLDTRAGEHPSIVTSDAFKRFRLEIDGPVQSVGYSNMARSTRQISTMLKQAGAIMPMMIGMMGAEVDAEKLEPIQEVVGLLPSVGQVVGKLDFLDSKLSVTQAGNEPGTYLRRSVIYVRPVIEEESADASAEE